MKVGDCMKRKVISAGMDITVRDAIQKLVDNRIGVLPITDPEAKLVGMVRVRDLITQAIPEFVHLLENVDFIPDLGAIETDKPGRDVLEKTVTEIMSEPVTVEATAGLVRAIALLQEHGLYDLPVVDEDMRLVGIASYVDIGAAIMSSWNVTD